MLYKHKCSPVIRNDVEKVTLDVDSISSSPPSSKSSDIVVLPFKLVYLYLSFFVNAVWLSICTFNLFQLVNTDFRLRQAWSFQHYYVLREVWDAHRKQASICVFIKQIQVFNFSKWPIVSLDKTLIHLLVSFIAPPTVWSPLKLTIWIQILNDSIKNINLFSTEERNT